MLGTPRQILMERRGQPGSAHTLQEDVAQRVQIADTTTEFQTTMTAWNLVTTSKTYSEDRDMRPTKIITRALAPSIRNAELSTSQAFPSSKVKKTLSKQSPSNSMKYLAPGVKLKT